MGDVPDPDTREEIADRIRDHPDADLVDFTRDVFKTMVVSVQTEAAEAELVDAAEDVGFDVNRGPDGQKLVFEARRGPRKRSDGGNRLMIQSSDRILPFARIPKKPASSQSTMRRVVGPGDEPSEPKHECSCGARYYGRKAAETCEAYHLLEDSRGGGDE